jgi:hypothetical protein
VYLGRLGVTLKVRLLIKNGQVTLIDCAIDSLQYELPFLP